MQQIKVRLDPSTSKVTWTIEGDVDDAIRMRECYRKLNGGRKDFAGQHLFALIDRLFIKLKAAGLDESQNASSTKTDSDSQAVNQTEAA